MAERKRKQGRTKAARGGVKESPGGVKAGRTKPERGRSGPVRTRAAKSGPEKRRAARDLPGERVSATDAQNNFGSLLSELRHDGMKVIVRHGTAVAVVLTPERYRSLAREEDVDLGELAAEYDRLVADMQTESTARAIDELFRASGERMGDVAARRGKRGRPAD